MTQLDELKKLITTVENEKAACEQSAKRSVDTFNASNQEGEDMDDNKEKIENEKVDKREILREADAIAMKPASEFKGGAEEKFRTLTKKMEELAAAIY